jgi:hypothetical protein
MPLSKDTHSSLSHPHPHPCAPIVTCCYSVTFNLVWSLAAISVQPCLGAELGPERIYPTGPPCPQAMVCTSTTPLDT